MVGGADERDAVAGAAAEFPRWNKATVHGVLTVLPGLVKRRTAERALFESAQAHGASGAATARFWWAYQAPVRPIPVWTSSSHSRVLCSAVISRAWAR